jgi:hypothetical protein
LIRIQLPSNKAKRYVHIQKDVKKKSAQKNFASIRKWKRGKKSPRGREGRDSSDG